MLPTKLKHFLVFITVLTMQLAACSQPQASFDGSNRPAGKNPNLGNGNPRSIKPGEAPILSLQILPATLTLRVGEQHAFMAKAEFADNSIKDVTESVTWTIDNENAGQINDQGKKGVFKALAMGNATITAEYDKNTTAKAQVTVNQDNVSVTKLVLSYDTKMLIGSSQKITVTAVYSDGSSRDVSDQASYKVRTTNGILELKSQSIVGALKAGTDYIDVTFSGATEAAAIEVTAKPIVSLVISPANPKMSILQQINFVLKGLDQDGGETILTVDAGTQWSSSATAKVSISNSGSAKGKAIAQAAGNATITATYNGLSATTAVIVETPPAISSITVTPSNPSLLIGQSVQMHAYAHYPAGTVPQDVEVTDSVVWTSDATNIGSFPTGTGKGLVLANSAGLANLTATLSGLSATTKLTVSENAPTCVAFTTSSSSVHVGEDVTLEVVGGGSISSVNIAGTVISSTTGPYRKIMTMNTAGAFDFAASVSGSGGRGDCSPVHINVEPAIVLPTCSMTTDKTAYSPGETVRITVTGTNITSAAFAGVTDSSAPFDGFTATAPAGGPVTYSATVANATHSASCSVSVAIVPAPVCSITTDKSSYNPGETVRFTVTGTNISNATVGGVTDNAAPFDSFTAVAPGSGSANYSAVVKNSLNASASCSTSISVVVVPTPVCSITADKLSYAPGETVKLTVTGQNISNATVAGVTDSTAPFDSFTAVAPASGSAAYSAVVKNSQNASASCSTSVTVVPPPTCTLAADKAAYSPGETVKLTVTGTNISNATIAGVTDNSSPFDSFTAVAPASGSANYSAVVKNSLNASASCSTSVTVVPSPTCTIATDKASYSPGETVKLTVTGTNISNATVAGTTDNSSPFDSFTAVAPASGSASYSAIVKNSLNASASCSTSAPVVPLPVCVLTSDKSIYGPGEAITLTATGTNFSRINIAGTELTSAPYQKSTNVPTTEGTATLSATAYNSANVSTQCSVIVNVKKPTCTLSSDASSVELGKTFNLSASVNYASKVVIDGTTYMGPFLSPQSLTKLKTADVLSTNIFTAQVYPLGSSVPQTCLPSVTVNYVAPLCVDRNATGIIGFEGSTFHVNDEISEIKPFASDPEFKVTFSLDGTSEKPVLTDVVHSGTDTLDGTKSWRCGPCGGSNFNRPGNAATDAILGDNVLTLKNAYQRDSVPDLIISYTKPVAAASGYLVDIDNDESWTVSAYDINGVLLGSTTKSDGNAGTGNGIATYWSLSRSKAEIAKIRVHGSDAKGAIFGFAFDRFSANAPICNP